MELFLDAWLDPDRHEVTRHVARRLIVAHHRGTTIEAKIMLVHAALEYLAWVTYVLSGKCSGKKYREARPRRSRAASTRFSDSLKKSSLSML
jgi:hypothetical protein